jgi:hypothetical protein
MTEAAANRVAIAKEAISLLDSGKVVPESGVWLDYPPSPDLFSDDDVANKVPLFEVMGKFESCNACGLGSLFVSAVRNFGGVTCEDIKGCIFLNYLTTFEIVPVLERYFPKDTLALVDLAFEGCSELPLENIAYGKVALAGEYRKQYPEAIERLDAILANIVKNDGEFIP